MTQPTLETTRLTLRPLTTADAADVYEFVSDPRVTRFMPYERHTCIETVVEWLRFVETDESEWNFAMVRKSDDKVIGCCSIGPDAHTPNAYGFGYNIRHDCWNKGYTTEATRAMIAYCRDTLRIPCFVSNHAADNPASGRVMEKCGLHYDHDITITSFDGTRSFPGKFYIGSAEDTRKFPNQ